MSEKTGITGAIVEQDDENLDDDTTSTPVTPPTTPKSLADVRNAVKASLTDTDPEEEEEEPAEEESPGAKPAEVAPAEPAPVETEPKPAEVDPDPLTTPKFTQADIDRIIDGVIKKERTREDNALKRLRDVELAAGMPIDQLLQRTRQQRISAKMDETGLDEDTARRFVEQEEKVARYEAEQARIQQEREEEQRANAYLRERNTFLADTTKDPVRRAFAQKYAAEIDMLSENGAKLTYEVARDFVLGQKMEEIVKAREEAVKAAATKPTGKAPVVSSTGRAPASAPVLTAQEKDVAHMMYRNLPKAEAERRYAKAKEQLAKTRGQ